VIEVSIISETKNPDLKKIALKYLKPENYFDKKENEISVTNAMGGETDWFILPSTFGEIKEKKLFEQYSAGLAGFEKEGIQLLKVWLVENEIIDNLMCY